MQLNVKSFEFLVSTLFFAGLTFANPKFNTLIVFGDSISGKRSTDPYKTNSSIYLKVIINWLFFSSCQQDNGNGTFTLTNGRIPSSPPYFEGRFSNGPVWNEYLADDLGIPLINRAFGGATTK